VLGYSPLESGLLMLPFAAAQVVFAPRSSALVSKYGAKLVCSIGLALVALSLVGFVLLTADTPTWVLEVVFFVQGLGMANVAAPTTNAIMSVLPREKAGVGSAVGNTMRQVGGALGVAVLGSVLSSAYRNQMDPYLTHLPAGARDAARESITATYAVAQQMGKAGQALIEPANSAFVHAMHLAAGGSAIVAVLAMLVVALWLPGRRVAKHERHAAVPEQRQAPRVAETTGAPSE